MEERKESTDEDKRAGGRKGGERQNSPPHQELERQDTKQTTASVDREGCDVDDQAGTLPIQISKVHDSTKNKTTKLELAPREYREDQEKEAVKSQDSTKHTLVEEDQMQKKRMPKGTKELHIAPRMDPPGTLEAAVASSCSTPSPDIEQGLVSGKSKLPGSTTTTSNTSGQGRKGMTLELAPSTTVPAREEVERSEEISSSIAGAEEDSETQFPIPTPISRRGHAGQPGAFRIGRGAQDDEETVWTAADQSTIPNRPEQQGEEQTPMTPIVAQKVVDPELVVATPEVARWWNNPRRRRLYIGILLAVAVTLAAVVAILATLGGANGAPPTLAPTSQPGVWVKVGQDIDGETSGDWSGSSVSLSTDGTQLAIGAPKHNETTGQVRVYGLNETGDIFRWTQVGSDIIGESSGDQSGSSVSLSGDATVVAIGSPGNDGNGTNSGHVRVYTLEGNNEWSQLGKDIDGEAAGDWSGFTLSLSTDGTTVAIGAYRNHGKNGRNSGHVRVYQLRGETDWRQVGGDIDGEEEGDWSGRAISLSANGTMVAVGTRKHNENRGHVRVYRLEDAGPEWRKVGRNRLDGEAANDEFGSAVSLSADGLTLAVGAAWHDADGNEDSGHVRIYSLGGSDLWEQIGNDINGEAAWDRFGSSVSLSANGESVAIGATQDGKRSGYVRVFQLEEGNWTQVGSNIEGEGEGDTFGWSVSLSADGTTVAVGAKGNGGNGPDSGHVRVYRFES